MANVYEIVAKRPNKAGSIELVEKILKSKTPKRWVKNRPGRGGKVFSYITHSVVVAVLNGLFGASRWNWKVDPVRVEKDVAIVKGRLEIILDEEHKIVKEEFGSKENPGGGMNIGDMVKSASSDALKRCSMRLGLFLDLYQDEEDIPSEIEQARSLLEFMKDFTRYLMNNFEKVDRKVLVLLLKQLDMASKYDKANETIYLGYKKLLEEKLKEGK